ncbi:MAG: N-acyl homoserine lactonase family protein [Pseudomonadota bacterium]
MWEVYAVKYADRHGRTRADSFLFDPLHDSAHAMDYFVWVLRRGNQVILVDTGYDTTEAAARGRPIKRSVADALAPLAISPAQVQTIICTHLHYDHAGGLAQFPQATVHLQQAEMVYATGPCMCFETLRMPYTSTHVAAVVEKLYSDKLVYHHGDGVITDGVTVHCIGGHSRGLQVVRVRTVCGWLVLASDASHYYENFLQHKLFPIVVDAQSMLQGFDTLVSLASETRLIIPGHDPLVMQYFPPVGEPFIRRLDQGPNRSCPL